MRVMYLFWLKRTKKIGGVINDCALYMTEYGIRNCFNVNCTCNDVLTFLNEISVILNESYCVQIVTGFCNHSCECDKLVLIKYLTS